MNPVDKILTELGLDPKTMDRAEASQYSEPRERVVRQKGACGKSMFESKASADAGARALLKHGRSNTSFLRTYLCPVCHAYHISSSHFAQ